MEIINIDSYKNLRTDCGVQLSLWFTDQPNFHTSKEVILFLSGFSEERLLKLYRGNSYSK